MPRLSRPSRLRRRWLLPAALLALLMPTCGPSANADSTVPAPWPGLPATTWPTGQAPGLGSIGAEGNGLTEAARARQWIKIPAQAVAAVTATKRTFMPADDPRSDVQALVVHVFLSSPAGASDGYGTGLPVTVHTVAFGAIPVQATMQLEQIRDADGLPVPLTVQDITTTYRASRIVDGVSVIQQEHQELTGRVRVRLTALSVDGVDIGLGDCASPPIELDLHSNPFWRLDPDQDANTHDPSTSSYTGASPRFASASKEAADWMAARGESSANNGGVNTGEVDIPAFSHCLARSGEDVSPLLTAVVSGPGNQVTVGTSAFSQGFGCGTTLPPPLRTKIARAPFSGDPSDCDPEFAPPTLDYPARQPH